MNCAHMLKSLSLSLGANRTADFYISISISSAIAIAICRSVKDAVVTGVPVNSPSTVACLLLLSRVPLLGDKWSAAHMLRVWDADCEYAPMCAPLQHCVSTRRLLWGWTVSLCGSVSKLTWGQCGMCRRVRARLPAGRWTLCRSRALHLPQE